MHRLGSRSSTAYKDCDGRLPVSGWPPPLDVTGQGRTLALDVLARFPGPWTMAFQHDNTGAGDFWRRTADAAFGNGRWSEEQRSVPGRPAAPPDHWIETT